MDSKGGKRERWGKKEEPPKLEHSQWSGDTWVAGDFRRADNGSSEGINQECLC